MSHLPLVQKVLDAFAAGDLDTLMDCLADDVVFEFPYSNEGDVIDKAAAGNLIGFVVRTFDRRAISIDRVYELAHDDGLILEYSSQFEATRVGVAYQNRYVAIFEFRDGLITRWREYANPLAFREAMAALEATAGRS